MNNNYEDLRKFTIQDITSIVFVVASVINIIASDKEKEYLISNNKKDKYLANNIYIIVLLILILLYIYFIKVNYQALKNCRDSEKETYLVRLYGSISFLIGAFCFLSFRINDKENIQSSVEI